MVGLQAWGVDPFAGFGPAALTPRLARYGRQDHLHADWLELWLTRGLLGVLAFGLALAAPLSAAWKRADALVFAALVAALSRALVDFPLERPADLCLLAVVSALAFLPEPPCAPSPSS